MSVISRSALESSSLADLHEIASELGLDGYRRLRKADLIGVIVDRQGGTSDADAGPDVEAVPDEQVVAGAESNGHAGVEAETDADERPARRSRRGGRGRSRTRDRDPGDAVEDEDEVEAVAVADEALASPRSSRPPRIPRENGAGRGDRSPAPVEDRDRAATRGDRNRSSAPGEDRDRASGRGERDRSAAPVEDRDASGTVELLPNGSGFLRVSPPEPCDDDVYISAAQVRRCELVSGDEVAGPARPPRRSERYPSLIRVDTINGRSADEVAEGTKYDDLPCTYATERIALDADDLTLKAIEWLTPFGRGSRVAIVGGPRAGKTEALRRLAGALSGQAELECAVVLAGVRPEEIQDWRSGPLQPVSELTLSAASDAHGQAIDRAVDTGRRVAARGGHAVVLIDTLEYVAAPLARRALAAARNIVDGGSLTIIATAREPLGGETTVIALDPELAGSGRIPALDLAASGTVRPELLVGEKGAEAIAEARAETIAG
ncbi:MAG: transcription termination factor Rho [Solirubrobacteraceae bacterium]|jgi:transcription termination factor Rho|nr:transcription termination factor Rho [Solirubrobacteraceae bacterium]